MLDVVQHAAGDELRGDDRDEPGEGDDQGDEQCVLVAHEHQQGDGDDGDQRLPDHDRDGEPELGSQRAEPAAMRGGESGGSEGARRHRAEHQAGDDARVGARDPADHQRDGQQSGRHDQNRARHEANR